MKHYTEFIPKDLALKLQDAGMKIEWEDNSPDEHPNTEVHCLTTYAEALDFLMDKGLWEFGLTLIVNTFCIKGKWSYAFTLNGITEYGFKDWQSAANKAIQHSLSLIKGQRKQANNRHFKDEKDYLMQRTSSDMKRVSKHAIKLLEETQNH